MKSADLIALAWSLNRRRNSLGLGGVSDQMLQGLGVTDPEDRRLVRWIALLGTIPPDLRVQPERPPDPYDGRVTPRPELDDYRPACGGLGGGCGPPDEPDPSWHNAVRVLEDNQPEG